MPNSEQKAARPDYLDEIRDAVLGAALPNVAFDGWSESLLRDAIAAADVNESEARMAFPRGVVDLAAAAHRQGDRRLREQMEAAGEVLRIREKITKAVRLRLEIAGEHEEAPHNAAQGARLTWGTADMIWKIVGDNSDDYNWYTKRLTLSGVYSTTLLYWLGDSSVDKEATWRFLDRRIDDVMRFEKVKAATKSNPLAKLALAGPRALLSRVRAPHAKGGPGDLPVGFPGR